MAGFTVVFVALGATASGIGRLLDAHEITLAHVSGVVIILLGVVMLLGALPSRVWANAGSGTLGMVSRVTGEHRFDVRPSRLGVWAAPLMGMAFAFAWTPCIGPVLGVVLGLAAHNGTLPGGVLLLFPTRSGWPSPSCSSASPSAASPPRRPGPASGSGPSSSSRASSSSCSACSPDGQHQLGLDAALQPAQRRRPGPALQELSGAATRTVKHSARTSVKVRAKVWTSPGQRAET